MILVDTNLLIYAVGADERIASLAGDVLAQADACKLRITPRVLEEFAHLHGRRASDRTSVREYCEKWSAMLGPLEFPSEEDLAMALEMWATQPRLDFADALLAAQAIRLGCPLVSADRAFAAVDGLQWIDLADPDLSERLRAT